MPPPPSLSPAPRMWPSLDVAVVAERGRSGGQAWWLDRDYLVLAIPCRLAPGAPVLVEVDVGLDEVVLLGRVIECGAAPAPEGWVHSVRWIRRDRGSPDALLARLRDEAAVFARPLRPPQGSASPDAPDPSEVPLTDRTSTRLARRWCREILTRQASATTAPLSLQLSAPPQPPSTHEEAAMPTVAPVFSPGQPPALFLPITDMADLCDVVAVIGHTIRLSLPPVPGVAEDEQLIVAMQLPRGLFVQFHAVVTAVGAHDLIVESEDSTPDTRTVLHDLIMQAVA